MRAWVTCVSIGAIVLGSAALAAAQGEAEAGKAVYVKKCGTCHGEKGEGKPAVAKLLKVEMRPLGSKDVQAKSDEDLKTIVVKGIEKMKPVQGLSVAEVASVVAFVRTLAQP